MSELDFQIAQLRHAYAQMIGSQFKDARGMAEGLLSPVIKALERIAATTPNVPTEPQPASEALSENQRWNLAGREPYKFHLSASHVTPEYRDGWNHAITAVLNYGHAECRRLLTPPSDSKGG